MTISTLFVEDIASDFAFQFTNHLRWVADELQLDSSSRSSMLTPLDDVRSQIRNDVETLASFAQGNSHASRHQIESIINKLLSLLHTAPGGTRHIPDTFWHTTLGQLIMRCYKRIHRNDWITHTEAANLIFGNANPQNLARLRRLTESGDMTRFIDPDAPNPLHAGRVLRSEARIQAAKHKSQADH